MTCRLLGSAPLGLIEQLFVGLPEVPFFAKDKSLRYVSANPAMARLCGVRSPAELIGRTARDFFQSPHCDRYEAFDRQVLASGRAVTDRLDLTRANKGGPVWLLFSRVPVTDGGGAIVGLAATGRRLPAPDRNDPTYRRLAGVVDQIRACFDAPLNLPRLAAMAGISRSQLERDFSALFGLTLQAFLHRTRIEHALKRLGEAESVAAVAQECGYSDHSAFTRRFGAIVGLSPSAYRQRLEEGKRD